MKRPFDCAARGVRAPRSAGLAARLRRGLDRARRLAQRALPQRCALCAAPAGDAPICEGCERDLPRLAGACAVCALPAGGAPVCGGCLADPPPFAATVAAFAYAFPVDRLLQRLKYAGQLGCADWLGAQLAGAVAAARAGLGDRALPDRLIALPLAASRQRERGFNQAREIAVSVARELRLPLAQPLERAVPGPPQAGLPLAARAANVRGAFACRTPLPGASVALVDDVMTTGATLAAAAAALRRGGAARVECWVVARTPPPRAR